MSKRKIFIVALAICLVAIISLGTLAWFTDEDQVDNKFYVAGSEDQNPDDVFSIDVWEDDDRDDTNETNADKIQDGIVFDAILPGNDLYKEVNVENTGAYDQYVRAIVTLSDAHLWQELYGEIYVSLDKIADDLSADFATWSIVYDVTVTGAYNVGGLLGQAQNETVENNTVKNVTVKSTVELPADASANEVRAAELAARSAFANTTIGNNAIENVEIIIPAVVSDQTALDNAIADGASTVILGSGEYVIPDTAKNKTMTIIGNGDTVVAVQDDGAAEGDIDYSFDGSTVTFENVTLNIKGNDHPGYARMSAVYNNCTITGSNYTLYGDSVFNNCTFNLNNGYVWTWGAANVEFNNCTFEDKVGGKAKAILVHNTVETVVTVKDCTFIATSPAQTWDSIPVAAVSIDPENGSPDATVHFEGTNTYSDAFYALYQVKYADEVDDVTITVDGVEVTVTAMK